MGKGKRPNPRQKKERHKKQRKNEERAAVQSVLQDVLAALEGTRVFADTLGPGDLLLFDTTQPHAFRNPSLRHAAPVGLPGPGLWGAGTGGQWAHGH